MFLMIFLKLFVIPGPRHPVEHSACGGEVRAPDVELCRVQNFGRFGRHCIKKAENAEYDEDRRPHDQHFLPDLGAGVMDIPVQKHQIEKRNGDFIGIHQHAFLTAQFRSVDKGPVYAPEIPDPGFPVFRNADFRVMAGDNIVPEDNVVLRSGSDPDDFLFQADQISFPRPVQKFQPVHVAGT